MRVELDVGVRERAERGLRQLQANGGRRMRRAVARIDAHEHDQARRAEAVEGGTRKRDVPVVRRVEGAAEEGNHRRTK
jgi:hypothetical protein